MFELPIVIDSTIKSECWTYFKTSIIETTNEGRKWLATNMNVFIDDMGTVLFGEGGRFYSMYYYEQILQFEEDSIRGIEPQQIVQHIKHLLQNKYYVIMDCNIARLSRGSDEEFQIHEILLYGYDDEKQVFRSPLLNKATGKPETVDISYEVLIEAYRDVRDFYFLNPNVCFFRSYYWFYPITKVKLKNVVQDSNEIIYKCLKKIEREYGKDIMQDIEEEQEYSRKESLNGLGCLCEMSQIIEKEFLGEEQLEPGDSNLTLSLLRLYEHRLNLLHSIELLNSLTGKCIETDIDGIAKYNALTVLMKKCYTLARKWDITGNEKILKKIHSILNYNLIEEEHILKQIFDTVQKYLCLQEGEKYTYEKS